MKLGALEIRSTRDLISPDTRLCTLIMAEPKQGKSVLAASLNEVTQKYRGKPTLIIACEVAEGGGTMTLHEHDYPYYMPKNWQDMEALLAQLTTDEQFGGIVLDNVSDYVTRIVKPYALKFPSKEENSKFAGTRPHGVLQQSDYLPLAEFARQQLAKLIALTNENTDPRYRKDLIVTSLEKERKTREGEFLGIQPDLPGALAGSVTAMFQSIVTVKKTTKVVNAGTANATRMDVRSVHAGGDPSRAVLGDRMGLWPLEASLTDPQGKPLGMLPLYEQWRQKMAAKAA